LKGSSQGIALSGLNGWIASSGFGVDVFIPSNSSACGTIIENSKKLSAFDHRQTLFIVNGR
jgi:hypothetical protein